METENIETGKSDTILVIEDDSEIAGVIELNIRDLGLHIEIISDGRKGLKQALQGEYALIILDIMLPGLDGLSVCRQIRAENRLVPILMLTAKSGEIDRVLGLEIGADDYLTKPFSVRELAARVKALLRRARTGKETDLPAGGNIHYNRFVLEPQKHKVTLGNRILDLTVKEFELLYLFIRNPGRVYSRSELLDIIWGYRYKGYEHTVNSHINRLRAKIEPDPADPKYLKTVWGVGYRFAEIEEL